MVILDVAGTVLVTLCLQLLVWVGKEWLVKRWRATQRSHRSTATASDSFSGIKVRNPKPFSGNSEEFKEWSFTVELALRVNHVPGGKPQVDFASSFLEGNALLWLIFNYESGTTFSDWLSLKTALANAFGPLQAEEDNRLALFALTQRNSLEEYVRQFSRLSLCVPDVDNHSCALLFVRGLQNELRVEALREHPHTLSEAIRAARAARRQEYLKRESTSSQTSRSNTFARTQRSSNASVLPRRSKLSDEERSQFLREGRCFKCREVGHLSKDCPEHTKNNPNAVRQ